MGNSCVIHGHSCEKRTRRHGRHPFLLLWILVLVTGCAPSRFLEEDELLLDRVRLRSDEPMANVEQLSGYIRQHPNSKWFSLFKVPLGFYCLSGTDSTRRVNRLIQRIGEPPVVYDSTSAAKSQRDIESAVRNLGYLRAQVTLQAHRHKRRIGLTYRINPGPLYTVSRLQRAIDDPHVDSVYVSNWDGSLLHEGMPFDINLLDRERSRLTGILQNMGYYRFNKSMVRFDADTTQKQHQVAVTLRVPLFRPSPQEALTLHPCFHLGQINYLVDLDPQALRGHTAEYHVSTLGEQRFYAREGMHFRPMFLLNKSDLHPMRLYSETDVQSTYSNLSSLSAVVGANVTMEPSATSPDTLDAYVSLLSAKRHGVSAEVEGTNSAGDLGAALSLGYQNRNLFRRSAQLGLTLRGAFEAIKGLEGYTDQNYLEYSAEASLNFPEFMLPLLSRQFRRSVNAQSIASVMYDSQDRPEFHRRVLTAAWRYRWNRTRQQHQYRLDLLDLNYVFMPWISETFRQEYLTDNGSRNAVLRYNYENLFIMKTGINYQYTSLPPVTQSVSYGQNAYSLRIGVELAGNLLYGLSHLFNTQHSDNLDAYTLFNIAYAQYAKFDFDFSKSFRFDQRNSLAMRVAVGAAMPYGNSSVLPYEKRYFAGGANSVRGWSVRGLGPGKFQGSDGRVDFIHQTGDLKLDLSVEWRSHLFWKIDGALFVDGGNVWTFREYEEQPGGQFLIDEFWKQIAVAYGAGFRLNFGYFILRLDGGMKAINPAYDSGRLRYPVIHPSFSRDFQFHFAVGLPF
ncbi:MAG: BamA/TamA family outer membrane protein [Bacteroidaceae bacterium]|nr:BamA/TamA family outer membrane protein [Bacteroidaceae bacterium]